VTRAGQDMIWIMDLLITCIHRSELHFTDNWHTQTCVLSLLESPLAVSCQRLLLREILQLPELRSSCHSLPCSTLVNWQLNSLGPRLAAISNQPSLLFTGRFRTELNVQSPASCFTSLHSTELLTTDCSKSKSKSHCNWIFPPMGQVSKMGIGIIPHVCAVRKGFTGRT
jgi:hypothetical protein